MLTLNDINLKDLKHIGKELTIKGFSIMRKPEMLYAITEAIAEDTEKDAFVEQELQRIEAETPVKDTSSAKKVSLGINELTFNGKTQSIKAWAEELGLQRPALYDRINRHGWSVEEALTIPAGGRRKTKQAKTEE